MPGLLSNVVLKPEFTKRLEIKPTMWLVHGETPSSPPPLPEPPPQKMTQQLKKPFKNVARNWTS